MDDTPETAKLLHEGRLEQMCETCGRWEAAGYGCSYCGREMGPTDWYHNNDLAERRSRLPLVAPVDPPPEYRRAIGAEGEGGWPAQWGPSPYVKKPRGAYATRVDRVSLARGVSHTDDWP